MSVEIVTGYRPGAIGAMTALHARYYSANWGFGLYFEAVVASELATFLMRFDAATDGIWLALSGSEIVGSIVVDGGEPEAKTLGAHLRVFIVDETLQGQGVGRDLLQRAVDFCDRAGYCRSYLSTFEGLDDARKLYERAGYRLVEQQRDATWGVEVNEQLFERLRPEL
jgi:GNAT superfamily N-acetyltransferase